MLNRWSGLIFFVGILCMGCAQTPEVKLQDRGRTQALSRGMEKKFVLNIMGTELMTVRDPDGDIRQIIPNPYDTQRAVMGGKEFEIVYYFTNPNPRSGRITKDELTPFVFDNSRLIGWGWKFMDFLAGSLKE